MRRLVSRRVLMVTLLIGLIVISSCVHAQDDDVAVDDVSEAVFRKRQKNRKTATGHGDSASPDDDDLTGVNDFVEQAHDTRYDSFGETADQQQQKDTQQQDTNAKTKNDDNDGSSKGRRGGGQSRRERYEEQKKAYDEHGQQQEKAKPMAPKFKPKHPADSSKLSQLAENIQQEAQHYVDALQSEETRKPDWVRTLIAPADGELEGKPAWQEITAAMDALPVGAVDVSLLNTAKEFLTKADKTLAKLRRRADDDVAAAKDTTADAKAVKAASDATKAIRLLDEAAVAIELGKQLFREHRRVHGALANTAMACSVASSGVAKAQLTLADELLAEVRKSDDGGVGDKQGRQRRKEIKDLHRFATQQVELYAKSRREALQVTSGSAVGVSSEAWQTMLLNNLMMRRLSVRDWPVASTGDYRLPPTLALFGLTLYEVLMVVLLTMVPYQAIRLCLAIVSVVRAFFSKKRAAPVKRAMPGAGRTLGSGATSPSRRKPLVVRFFIELALSVGSSAALVYFAPALSLPAFAYITPSTLVFTITHFVPMLQLVVLGFTVTMLHLSQVSMTL